MSSFPLSSLSPPDQGFPVAAKGGETERPEDPPDEVGWRGRLGTPATPPGTSDWASPRTIKTYTVVPASKNTGIWINQLLLPVLDAIGANPRPIEFRPLGEFYGLSAGSKETNPDGRIQLAGKVILCQKKQLISLYVHELAHCLLDEAEESVDAGKLLVNHGHDAAFFALNLTLLKRIDAADGVFKDLTLYALTVQFYDLQDAPPFFKDLPDLEWKPKAIEWAMNQAEKYSGSSDSAIEVAIEISQNYWNWCDDLAAEPGKVKAEKSAQESISLANASRLKEFESDLSLFKSLFWLMLAGFFAIVYLVGARS